MVRTKGAVTVRNLKSTKYFNNFTALCKTFVSISALHKSPSTKHYKTFSNIVSTYICNMPRLCYVRYGRGCCPYRSFGHFWHLPSPSWVNGAWSSKGEPGGPLIRSFCMDIPVAWNRPFPWSSWVAAQGMNGNDVRRKVAGKRVVPFLVQQMRNIMNHTKVFPCDFLSCALYTSTP